MKKISNKTKTEEFFYSGITFHKRSNVRSDMLYKHLKEEDDFLYRIRIDKHMKKIDKVLNFNKDITNSDEDVLQLESLIDIEALVLFKEHTKLQLLEYKNLCRVIDDSAETNLDKVERIKLTIIDRAVDFHERYEDFNTVVVRHEDNNSIQYPLSPDNTYKSSI